MAAPELPEGVAYDSILLAHAEPVARTYVLLHGLSASPQQFAAFAATLHERGANVYVPRLPRHGFGDRLTPELAQLTAAELRGFATASIAFARPLAAEVHVVGFSLGGLLAAWIAQNLAVERATCVAPFLGVAWLPGGLSGGVGRVALRLPNRFLWWNPLERERQMPAHGYPRFATHAVAEAIALAGDVMREAERDAPVAREVTVLVNDNESTVSNAKARRLAELWSRRKGSAIVLHRLRGLPLSHDIIEPERMPMVAGRVAAALLDLVER